MDDVSVKEALRNELRILQSMYPEQLRWVGARRELWYASEDDQSSFGLRLPDDYLVSALPELVIATIHKDDARNALQARIKQCDVGVEVLDIILDHFNQMVEAHEASAPSTSETAEQTTEQPLTVIVWLHHLLNTNKRKQALAPSLPSVSGITKPGYPGVLVYSGPASAVSEHVKELKSLNWQAFQVRLEADEEWRFSHNGVVEVESMAEVVSAIDPVRMQDFLQAMNIT